MKYENVEFRDFLNFPSQWMKKGTKLELIFWELNMEHPFLSSCVDVLPWQDCKNQFRLNVLFDEKNGFGLLQFQDQTFWIF